MQSLMVSRWIPPIFTDLYFSKDCPKKQRDYVLFDTHLNLWYVKLVSSTSKEGVERNIL